MRISRSPHISRFWGLRAPAPDKPYIHAGLVSTSIHMCDAVAISVHDDAVHGLLPFACCNKVCHATSRWLCIPSRSLTLAVLALTASACASSHCLCSLLLPVLAFAACAAGSRTPKVICSPLLLTESRSRRTP